MKVGKYILLLRFILMDTFLRVGNEFSICTGASTIEN